MGEVVKLKTNGVPEIINALVEMQPDELVVIAYSGGDWITYASEVSSRTTIVGAMELLKNDLINM